VLSALTWGLVAASSLIIGALAGVARDWSARLVGLVLGFGAGALIASISFELAEEGVRLGGELSLAVGLAIGAIAFFAADKAVDAWAGNADDAGLPLLIGALLDGIPEQAVLGIGIAAGGAVSPALLVAIFVSNLPESIGSATDLKSGGQSRTRIVLGWIIITALCALATVAGFAFQEAAGPGWQAGIDGFAAGALLVMLVTSMIPEARKKAGEVSGLAAVLGFAVAAGLALNS
jgi:zinc transporter, ZIP family